MDARAWTVPGERMKAGREHRVPLSDRALAILDEARVLRDATNLAFPGMNRPGEHDSQWSALPSVASKLGCTAQTLRKWVRQADSRFRGNDVRPRGPCGAAQ